MLTNDFFDMNHSTRICFGTGRVADVGEETLRYGDRALVICDTGVVEAGIVEKVCNSLTKWGIMHTIFDEVVENPRDTGCYEAAEEGMCFKANVIIGVGGGSVMDTAKAVSVFMSNGGDCETWAKAGKFDRSILPIICVPTTSGTGSEVTYEAVITIVKTRTKVSISDGAKLAPKIAIMDPELTLSVPPLVTASTGMDALTHAIESYTCRFSNHVSEGFALYATEKIAGSIVTATTEGLNLKARTDMMIGSMMAGMAFANSCLGAVHAVSETLGGFYDIPHGIANSIFLPFVTRYNIENDIEKHATIARCLGIDTEGLTPHEASNLGVEKLFEMNQELEIPRFSQIHNVNPDDFAVIAEKCADHSCTGENPRQISRDDYLKLLYEAYRY